MNAVEITTVKATDVPNSTDDRRRDRMIIRKNRPPKSASGATDANVIRDAQRLAWASLQDDASVMGPWPRRAGFENSFSLVDSEQDLLQRRPALRPSRSLRAAASIGRKFQRNFPGR
ncbi:hypothetical protein [Rhodoblastus sp.]|uniref:hypothetical protein n=1 Tax=Rhodoblastus sp. TaxID=1962975 RepID=UPI002602CA4D|nr:hypothetical protein [Rhodoblastus sp.]